MKYTIYADSLPHIPWQDGEGVIWRYSENPVIPRNRIPGSNSIFNSAVVPFGTGFAGVFRCDDQCRRMAIHRGFSDDGITWNIDHRPLKLIATEGMLHGSEYQYDPRLTWIEDRWWVSWCNGYKGPTIGLAWTKDFDNFYQVENAFLPFNRNGVIFPRKISGHYAMLSRPSDSGHTPFGDIFYSESPDMEFWGRHRHVMAPAPFEESAWQCTKVGAGPIPIETSEGWLLIYHGVLTSCNGFVYSMGAAILDRNEPWKILHRSRPYLLSPQTPYECTGDVPNVVFPCAALCDAETGRLAIYYGAADTVTGLAFCRIDDLIDFIKDNDLTGN